jgi:G3E family GTPase
MRERVPFSIVTGALGSGKTTLLARLLRHPGMARTGVVVNEFGEVGLDAALIGHPGEQTVVLAGGCVCCAATADFVSAVRALEARAGSLSRVILETSGLADPVPILHALGVDAHLAAGYVPGSVIATVDALQGERELGRQPVVARQVAVADRIVLSKSDIASPRAVLRLRQRLREINPTAEVLVVNHGDVAPEQVFGVAAAFSRLPPAEAHAHRHGPDARAVCLARDGAVCWDEFGPALEQVVNALGDKLLRVKGLLNTAGSDRPLVLQGVRGFLHPPVRIAAWPSDDRFTRIVFITEGLDDAAIQLASQALSARTDGDTTSPPGVSAREAAWRPR